MLVRLVLSGAPCLNSEQSLCCATVVVQMALFERAEWVPSNVMYDPKEELHLDTIHAKATPVDAHGIYLFAVDFPVQFEIPDIQPRCWIISPHLHRAIDRERQRLRHHHGGPTRALIHR